jgi:hypothetical protein
MSIHNWKAGRVGGFRIERNLPLTYVRGSVTLAINCGGAREAV